MIKRKNIILLFLQINVFYW